MNRRWIALPRFRLSWKTVSLARASLIYEARRYWPAVVAVAFSGLLFLVQGGLLLGIFGTVSVVIDHAKAHVWITSVNTPSFDLGRLLPIRHEMTLRLQPDIVNVEPMLVGAASWRGPDGRQLTTTVIGVEARPDSIGVPDTFSILLRQRLAEPDAVVVDDADREKLGAAVGDMAEINGKAVRIVGLTARYRSIGGAYIFTSIQTARRLLDIPADKTTYLLATLHDTTRLKTVRNALSQSADATHYHVWATRDFSIASQSYWLLESGAGASFGFSSLLGFLVGLVVTAQTLLSAVHVSLREYATLRALGVPARALGWIVLEQSFWIGLGGMAIAGVGVILAGYLAQALDINLSFPWWMLIGGIVLMLAVACASGLFALRALFKTEPMQLLR